MKHYFLTYISTLIIISLLDIIFLAGVAGNFYKSRITNFEFHATPAVLFYLMYTAGVLIFANGNASATWQNVIVSAALLGFFAYATYDFTNLATLRGWSVLLAVVDIAWGTFVTSAAATGGFFAARLLERI